MAENMKNALKEFGLTNKETQVYLALLNLGTSLVQEISRKAGTYRTYTYEILKSLKEKGLVSYVIKSGKQYFEPAEPDKLINILKEKQAKINDILPDLKEIYKQTSDKPKIEVYEGKQGIKTILDDILRSKQELLIYGSTKKQIKLLNFYFPSYIKRRIKAKIRAKVITEMSKEGIEVQKKDSECLRETRLLPKEMDFPTTTNIYGNKVAILSLDGEPTGIIIDNKAIADTQRMIFDLFWKATGTNLR
ncbi:hypothetical protein HOK51_01380 [Candidatus Woesearchaeota archaeon]|jgi:sugar-specific transcriptional regulator TrmB|nr:hypothetical protein [Candidatus Woesearchaeota archaeon]MBT6518465.1 hypothetical protein [Candidatus Woesearchaeota archaeon]MBT7366844.1 hypothetical protein [Candidatus Woesearchaeota archaeon]